FLPAARAQETLDDAILQTVERDDREAAAGPQHSLGRVQPALQRVQFAIQMDTNGLKGARRRVRLVAGPLAKRAMHRADQIANRGERARRYDEAGYTARLALLAIAVEDVGKLRLIHAIEELGRRLAGLTHPHIQRRV